MEEPFSIINLPLILNIMEIWIFLCLPTLLLGLKHEGLTAPLPSQLATGPPKHREPPRAKRMLFPPLFWPCPNHTALHAMRPVCEPAGSPLLPSPRYDHAEAGWVTEQAVTSMPGTQKDLVISRINRACTGVGPSCIQGCDLSQKGLDIGIDSCEISCWQRIYGIPSFHKQLQNQSRYLIWFLSLNELSYIDESHKATSFALQLLNISGFSRLFSLEKN